MQKNFGYKVKDIDEKGVVSIYVNGFGNLDSDNEISAPGSFDKTIRENFKRIKHLKDHDRTQLLGLPLEFIPDGYGLLTRSAMNLNKQMVKDVYEDYKFFMSHDRSIEHSIGYRVMKDNMDRVSGIRTITEYKLLEYSTLSFLGANENTQCVDIKEDADKLQSDIKMLGEMLAKGNYSDEKFVEIENKLKDIQTSLTDMKTLNTKEPDDTTPIVEPDSLFENKEVNFIQIINQIQIK
jgi:HK97 family phage prohead protease